MKLFSLLTGEIPCLNNSWWITFGSCHLNFNVIPCINRNSGNNRTRKWIKFLKNGISLIKCNWIRSFSWPRRKLEGNWAGFLKNGNLFIYNFSLCLCWLQNDTLLSCGYTRHDSKTAHINRIFHFIYELQRLKKWFHSSVTTLSLIDFMPATHDKSD